MNEVLDNSTKRAQIEESASNLGWGIGFLVAGAIMVAAQFGLIKNAEWLVSAGVVGLAVHYLYKWYRGS